MKITSCLLLLFVFMTISNGDERTDIQNEIKSILGSSGEAQDKAMNAFVEEAANPAGKEVRQQIVVEMLAKALADKEARMSSPDTYAFLAMRDKLKTDDEKKKYSAQVTALMRKDDDFSNLAELAGRMQDKRALPLLVSHLALVREGGGMLGASKSGFTSRYPCAGAIFYMWQEAIPLILDAVNVSKNADFDDVAQQTLEFMYLDSVNPMLERYQSIDDKSKLAEFIRSTLKLFSKDHVDPYIQRVIAKESDPVKQTKLKHLEASL